MKWNENLGEMGHEGCWWNEIWHLKEKTQSATQIKFYKVKSVPFLMYGSENWSLSRSDKRKIEAAEIRFLRSLAGYTLRDKKEVAT